MHIVSKSMMVANVAMTWKSVFHNEARSQWTQLASGVSAEEVYFRLLGARDEAAITQAIGSDSWTRITCSECQRPCDMAIVLSELCGGDINHPIYICKKCLSNAIRQIEAAEDGTGRTA